MYDIRMHIHRHKLYGIYVEFSIANTMAIDPCPLDARLRWLVRRARQTSPRTSRVLNVRSTVFFKEQNGVILLRPQK